MINFGVINARLWRIEVVLALGGGGITKIVVVVVVVVVVIVFLPDIF